MPDHYEKLLQRVGELEMDLGQTVAANTRLASDVQSLRKVHQELVDAYDRMKTQHVAAKQALSDERQRYNKLEHEFSAQLNEWHDKMLHKAKELEELQQMPDPAREIEMIRLKVSEELEGPYLEKLEQAEKRAELEQRKFNDAKRQIEVLKLELNQKNKELLSFEEDTKARLDAQRQLYQGKIDSLQSDLDKNTQLAGTTTSLRQQVYERAAKNKALLEELETAEVRHKEEVEDLRKTVASAQAKTREMESSTRELEAALQQQKREKEDLSTKQLRYIAEVDQSRESLLRLRHLQDTEAERERAQTEFAGRLKRAETDAELRSKEIEVKDEEIKRLKARSEQFQKESAAAITEADQRIADAELQVTAEKDATTHALASLKSEVEHLRTQLRDKESTYTKDLSEYENKLEALTRESHQLKLTCETEEKRARDNDRKAREYDSLERQHYDLERQHREVSSAHATLKSTNDAAVNENRKLVEKLEEVNRLHAENRRRTETDSEKQMETIKATLQRAEKQIDEKEKALHRVKDETKQLATSSKKKIEGQKQKTKQLLDRYTSMVTEKEQAIRIAETNKKKYELQMLQVHKLLNDPILKEHLQPSFDQNLGVFKELQNLRDCLNDAIYNPSATVSPTTGVKEPPGAHNAGAMS
ncbi:unnamed protein product [Amoebophrya sp. A120]|nr:unnamed protein product [Amoebophrya sp. A120]|eukprot:GSA120T00001565001.1